MAMMRAIGLMSGTSLDGVDVALIETDGERVNVVVGHNGCLNSPWDIHARPYSADEKALLHLGTKDAEAVRHPPDRPGRLRDAEALITEAHAQAVEQFLAKNNISANDIDVVGFHGQTVIHRPADRLTVQIGDAKALAARLGIKVVADFRSADVAAGGQGAPLVPIFHKALAEASGLTGPFAVLNIGGVANVTLFDADGELSGFDTGPGNALIDDWMRERTGADLDEDGATAARGRPDEALLAWLLTHPYFLRPPPKSLDRNWFSHTIARQLSTEDGAATLTAFTARAVARALDFTKGAQPKQWIVAGGGAKNNTMMALLKRHLGCNEVVTAEERGWSSAYLEAQAFAHLAVRSLAGLAITFPKTTGVSAPMTGGKTFDP